MCWGSCSTKPNMQPSVAVHGKIFWPPCCHMSVLPKALRSIHFDCTAANAASALLPHPSCVICRAQLIKGEAVEQVRQLPALCSLAGLGSAQPGLGVERAVLQRPNGC
jgi:hypothetical protein